MPTYLRLFACALFCALFATRSAAQTVALKDSLLSLTTKSDSFNHQKPAEKIFIQIDKPYYAVNDTLWFKAYVLNAAYLTPTYKSGFLYVDIADSQNQPIKHFRFAINQGLSWGNISLDKKEVKAGSYILRAYTRWLQNFGNDYYLYKRFDVVDSVGIVTKPQLTSVRPLKQKVKQLKPAISATPNIDLQFMPESGFMLEGMQNVIAFKAIGADGLSRRLSGQIFNQAGQAITSLSTGHKGMGRFTLLPKPGETYFALITMPDSSVKDYPLPVAKPSGTVLNVSDGPGEVTVIAYASKDIVDAHKSYFLIGKARGIVCYAAVISFGSTNRVFSKIPADLFPTGIAHFSLLDTTGRPLNERLLFIDHHDRLSAALSADKAIYHPRDSVFLQLSVSANNFALAAGNFSISITDDSQVAQDSTRYEDIATRMLLTADLKGNIEDPGYYFRNVNPQTRSDLDNLLLTQGWVGYNWHQELLPPVTPLPAEPVFAISGRVVNGFNKAVDKPVITLLSSKPIVISETTGNKNGRFIFNDLPLTDTAVYVLTPKNKRGRAFNLDLKIDEVQIPPFNATIPPNLIEDTTSQPIMQNFAQKQQQYQLQKDELAGISHRIAEVKIVAKKIVKGSANVNGAGNADIVIDEKELERAGKKTFLDLLMERVPNFREGYLLIGANWPEDVIKFDLCITGQRGGGPWYLIRDKAIVLFIDGVEMKTLVNPFVFRDCQNFLLTHNAEDIKGIEVNLSPRYNRKYLATWAPNLPTNEFAFRDFAFIEITTRSGAGPGIRRGNGSYLYKPTPLSYPAAFYSPRYLVKKADNAPADPRSTIYWQPNVITGKDGKAAISFCAADTPGTYTVILEGTDLNGNFGSDITKIKVE